MNTKTPTTINMREFLRNTKKIKEAVSAGEEFHVYDRSKLAFVVTLPRITTNKKKYTFADLEKFRFKGSKNSSQDIDAIVYGG